MVKPPKIRRSVPIGVAECAKVGKYKLWRDSESGEEHNLNSNTDTTYINQIPIGEMYISGGYSYCDSEERRVKRGFKF